MSARRLRNEERGTRDGTPRARRPAFVAASLFATVCLAAPMASAVFATPRRSHAVASPALIPRSSFRSSDVTARLAIARLQYDGGGDWYANPSSLPNLLAAIAERTSLDVDRTEGRVTLTDDRLWDYPFLHATGHGYMVLTDEELARLREHLTRGGYLHVSAN